jgi:diguanylate cyclase (GGDEF)-like protein
VLITLSRRLRRVLRDDESVGRFSGDEFVVCAQVDDAEGAHAIAERIAGVLGARVTVQGHAVNPTVSIGIAITDDTQRTPDTLLREADDAMQRAKTSGRATVAMAGAPATALSQPAEPTD